MKNNIILIGFMGSGKSKLGEMLARKLKRDLYDLDDIIEKNENLSIKDIFHKHGEPYFRELEQKTIKNLAHIENAVLVSGGGTPLNFDNAHLLKKMGYIFFLDANFDLIVKRLNKNKNRPLALLNDQADLAKLKELFYFRRPIYQSLGSNIDANKDDIEQILNDIVEIHNGLSNISKFSSIKVINDHSKYHIYFASLNNVKDIKKALGLSNKRPVIISTNKIIDLYKAKFNQALSTAQLISINDGEEHKNYASINHIHEELFKHNNNRQTLIFAIGGGVVGDVAGFAASTYMRGIPLIHVPTSLLAMVDSSVGAKTGIDTAWGKNLIGSFFAPKAIIIDTDFLKTLPSEEYSSGMAEVIKHAIIGDLSLFKDLATRQVDDEELINRAVKVKCHIVAADPSEKHIRAYLNLGHTFAHAIEKVSKYQIKHGQAVSMGMVQALKLAKMLGVLKEDFSTTLIDILIKYNLPISIPSIFSAQDILQAMRHDKKHDNTGLKFVLPIKLGSITTEYVNDNDILQCLSS